MAIQTFNNFLVMPGQTFATSAGDNDDVALTSSILVATATNDNDIITGCAPPIEIGGGFLWIANASLANTLVLSANDTGSTAGYRFVMSGNMTLETRQSGIFFFVSPLGWFPYIPGVIA